VLSGVDQGNAAIAADHFVPQLFQAPGHAFGRGRDQTRAGGTVMTLRCLTIFVDSLLTAVPAAQAAVFTVNTTVDGSDFILGLCDVAPPTHRCSLRAAIEAANALPGPSQIILPPQPPGTAYVLTIRDELTIKGNLTITGGGASTTIIDGNGNTRVIGNTGIANISGVTIRYGRADPLPLSQHDPTAGAGILNRGTMTLTNSTVTGNAVDIAVMYCGVPPLETIPPLVLGPLLCGGGGIYNDGGTLTLFDSTVSGNTVETFVGIICSDCGGGGIYNRGTLTLVRTTVSGNRADDRLAPDPVNKPGIGGGIFNAGVMTLIDSTIGGGNIANYGGGLHNDGTMTVVNSTVSDNNASEFGGGIDTGSPVSKATTRLINTTVSGNSARVGGGGIHSSADGLVNVCNSTITNNQADANFDGIGFGGGVNVPVGTLKFQNTIIAGNSETRFNPFLGRWGTAFRDCAGAVLSVGNNVMRSIDNCNVSGDPPTVADPLLGPLRNNGGPTQTHALLAGSPAIDGGDPSGCRDWFDALLPTDQRGFPRPVDGVSRCDIGAYEVFTGSTTSVVAAILPSSRSVQLNPATFFATIINAGPSIAAGCGITPVTSVPAIFVYQTTDPVTNQGTWFPNTTASIAVGAAQNFIIAMTPTVPIAPTEVQFSFACANSDPASVHVGLNTVLLSASATPVPDIVALATASGGIVDIPGATGTGVLAVATVNVGAGGRVTASADTGSAALPVNINLCQTNPVTGECISTIGTSVTTQIDANATPTFGIFVQGNGTVPFDPAGNRVFIRFRDEDGITRGSTSVAVRTHEFGATFLSRAAR